MVTTEHLPTDTIYLTLSHCWEGYKGHIPLEHLLMGVETTKFPKNFQDALEVARKLGIPYIWIGSLCINQASEDDWARESAQMCYVYLFSWCNIVSCAASSTDTMFATRSPLDVRPCIAEARGERWIVNPPSVIFRDNVESTPIYNRGWFIQESFLTPCQLYVGRYQLYWKCSGMGASESFPSGHERFIPGRGGSRYGDTIGLFEPRGQIGRPLYENTLSISLWPSVVERYSE